MLGSVPVYIERVPNRSSPPAILLRESFRKDGKVCKRTVLNVSKWPPHLIEGLRALLKGGTAISDFTKSFTILRSERYGHVAATLGSIRQLGLDALIDTRPSRSRDLACALIVDRVLQPLSESATVLEPEDLSSSIGTALGLGPVSRADLDRTMDWLLERQSTIEDSLVKRRLAPDWLALVYVIALPSASRSCLPSSRRSRDGKRAGPQTLFGLLCSADGCPVAARVFDGDSTESSTVGPQIDSLRQRFGLERVVLVGDRSMPNEPESLGFDWITSLRRPAIRQMVATGVVQSALADQRDLVESTNPDYPGQRLLVWRNLDLAKKCAKRREESVRAVEAALELIAEAVLREHDPLRGAGQIGLRVGMAVRRSRMAKHFELRIGESEFSYVRKPATIAAEAALDGLSVIHTSLAAEDLPAREVVRVHQKLGQVEQAFRSYQASLGTANPTDDRGTERLEGQALLCMLAYHVEWHMRAKLAPLLSTEQDPLPDVEQSSSGTPGKANGLRMHSFPSLLENLSAITCNRIEPRVGKVPPFELLTRPTELQQRAFALLGVKLG